MRHCSKAVFAAFIIASGLLLPAQQTHAPAGAHPAAQSPTLTQDTDPVRSPDTAPPVSPTGPLEKKGEGYLLHADVEEVVLNATVLNGSQLVENLTKDDFTVYRGRGQAEHHQLPAHRSARVHGIGGRQFRIDVPETAFGQ